MINMGVEQDLQFNPGNHSLDGDGKAFNASVRFFHWIRIRCFSSSFRIGLTNIFIASVLLHSNLWMSLSTRIVRRTTSTVPVGNGAEWMIQFDLPCWSVDIRSCRIWRLNGCWEWKINGIYCFKALVIFLFMLKKRLGHWSTSGKNNSLLSFPHRCVSDVSFEFWNFNESILRLNSLSSLVVRAIAPIFKRSTGRSIEARSILPWTISPIGFPSIQQLNRSSVNLFFSGRMLDCLDLKGSKTRNFTVTKDLFSSSRDVVRWRFEVIYSFSRVTSSSSLNFERNSPPTNGSCSIQPETGSTSTPFNISCPSWFDEDQIGRLFSFQSLHRFLWIFSTHVDRLLFGSLELSCLSSFGDFILLTRWLLSFEIETVVFVNGTISRRFVHNRIRTFSKISRRSSTDNRHRVPSFNFWTMEIQIKLDKWSHLSHNTSIFNKLCQVKSSFQVEFRHRPSRFLRSILHSLRAIRTRSSSSREIFLEEFNRQAEMRQFLAQFQFKQSISTLKTLEAQAKSLRQLTASSNQLTRHVIVRRFRLLVMLIWCVLFRETPLNGVWPWSQIVHSFRQNMSKDDLLQSATNLLTVTTSSSSFSCRPFF